MNKDTAHVPSNNAGKKDVADTIANTAKDIKKMSKASKVMLSIGGVGFLAAGAAMYHRQSTKLGNPRTLIAYPSPLRICREAMATLRSSGLGFLGLRVCRST